MRLAAEQFFIMTSEAEIHDVIVIGCGAAGLMAAASAGARGRRVLVLEKNSKPGVKILISGGTRCNITHHCDVRGISEAFGRQGRFLLSALAGLSPEDVIHTIEAQGVKTKVESTGKIFPESDRAIDVRVSRLRSKLQDDPNNPKIIKTIYGAGYIFIADLVVS